MLDFLNKNKKQERINIAKQKTIVKDNANIFTYRCELDEYSMMSGYKVYVENKVIGYKETFCLYSYRTPLYLDYYLSKSDWEHLEKYANMKQEDLEEEIKKMIIQNLKEKREKEQDKIRYKELIKQLNRKGSFTLKEDSTQK